MIKCSICRSFIKNFNDVYILKLNRIKFDKVDNDKYICYNCFTKINDFIEDIADGFVE